jgi:uncharacterized membrane protein YsdA (DUF1294 family)
VWTVLLIAAAVLNLAAFAAFGIDKARARSGGRRIPEARLLALAFLTGLIGAWAGLEVFRHKTRKTSFKAKLVLVTVLNPAWVFLYLAATGGHQT